MSPNTPEKPQEERYNAFITGEVLDGYASAKVQAWLATTLNITPSKAAILLTGSSKCIKQGLDKAAAVKFRTLFESNGVAVRVLQQKAKPAAPEKKTSQPAEQTAKTQVMQSRFFNGTLTSQPPKWKASTSNSLLAGAVTLVLGTLLCATLLLVWIALRAAILALFPDAGASLFEYALLTAIPGLIAGFLAFLLLRPFIAAPHAETETFETDSRAQVKLVQFIKEIYQQVGATPPDRLLFSNDLHCHANYTCRFPHLLSGTRELTIGLPLIVTLDSQQLAVLIAHEAARLKMPASALVQFACKEAHNRLDGAANNTDSWAMAAEQKELNANGRLSHFVAAVYHRLVIFSALLIKPFAHLLALATEHASHTHVFLADHSSAALMGSRQLSETFVQLHRTTQALLEANEKVFSRIGERKLPDNFPILVQHFFNATDSKSIKALTDEVDRGETRRHHDYPTDRERIIRAEDLELTGIESQQLPASSLLENANAVYRQATRVYYQHQELDFSDAELVEVRELTNLAQKDQLRDQLSADYFNQWFNPQVFWQLPSPSTIKPLNQSARIALLNENITRIRHATPDFLQLLDAEVALNDQLVHLSAANEVRKAGYHVVAPELSLTEQQLEDFQQHYEKAKISHQGFRNRYGKLIELMGTRLFLAIALHPDANRRKVGLLLLQALASLTSQNNKLQSLRIRVGYLPLLMARMSGKKEANLEKKIQRVTKDINEFCASVLSTLESHNCSFHDDYATIAQFVRAHVKQEFDHQQAQTLESIDYYYEICHGLREANRMVNSQLALIARDSEQANKITPVRLTG